jgi:hypothetical protein
VPLRTSTKWIVLLIVWLLASAALVWIGTIRRSSLPIETVLAKTDHVEFRGESIINDGGSRWFDFRARGYGWFAVKVRHRSPDGGRPDFQEILLLRRARDYFALEPRSSSEQQFLRLLQSATIKTNHLEPDDPARPTPERLQWLVQRIQDRKSTW